MASKKKPNFDKVEVIKKGRVMVLPEGMDFDKAIDWLQRRKKEEEQSVSVREVVDAYPFDGAHAFYQAMIERYGWVQSVDTVTKGFFGESRKPPTMIGVEVDYGTTVQVPWGRFEIPNVIGFLDSGVAMGEDGFPQFCLTGTVQQKYKAEILELADAARKYVREHSIYRGKAVRVSFPRDSDDELQIGPADSPKFMDVSGVRAEELVFPDATQSLIDSALFAPIEHTAACRTHKIPLKRGVLLEGPYGTGKTLTAYVTAKRCVDNAWTFIYLDDLDELHTALRFAKKYSPAVIFAEDLDELIGEDRDEGTNQVLNTIDGVDSKDAEVIVVLTTNHVENIHPAMLRPGRLDAVVPVRPPDEAAVGRLVELYARGLLAKDEDLREVSRTLAGQIPAVIREVIERSKLSAIRRGGKLALKSSDLLTAAQGMLAHLELIRPKAPDTRSDIEKAAGILGAAMANGKSNGARRELTAKDLA